MIEWIQIECPSRNAKYSGLCRFIKRRCSVKDVLYLKKKFFLAFEKTSLKANKIFESEDYFKCLQMPLFLRVVRYHDYQLMLFSLLLLLLLLKLFPKKKKKNFLWATSKTTNKFNKKKIKIFVLKISQPAFLFTREKGKTEEKLQ